MPISDAVTIRVVDTSALAVGSDFGTRYRIEALLGQGGMGRVYKAYDKQLDRTVAIKVVRQGMMGSDEALKRFKQELLLASKVSHKNILRIHDMGEVGEVKFISMAFVEGQDLHQILHDTPQLPFPRVLNFARQLAEALEAAQTEGVVHRDLKPQNILVGKNDQLYVSDFGLAKSFDDDGSSGMTKTGAFLGTPRYMSPEQVEGNPADHRSDIYAYGLILYEMATGDVPFTGESTLKLMYQRIQTTPKNPKLVNPDLPEWFAAVVMRCLERDPAARYQTATEVLADLQTQQSADVARGVAATTTAASSVGATRTVQIQIPHFAAKKWVWGVAGAVALLVLAFAIPPVRHLVLPGTKGTTVHGIPSLDQGRFVAILPFRVLGDEQSLGYVAEGLNEALSAKLFQLKDLRLASSSAVEKISDKDPTDKIARALGVNLIVTGMVQGSPDNMRIIINLDDATSGKRTWSQEFSGVTKDLLSIEDQISGQLVTALNVNPTNDELAKAGARPTDNVEAYDLYLRGRQALRGPNGFKAPKDAIDLFQQAVQKDPEFALAYTGLADASLQMYANTKDSFWSQKALGSAQRAEQLKDSLPEVHFALGSVYQATGKTAEAIVELKKGLELSPNSEVGYVRLGRVYLENGQKDEAIAAYKKAIDVDPYYPGTYIELGRAYFSMGQNDRAVEELKRVTELEPDNVTGWNNLATAYAEMGKYDESSAAYQRSIDLSPSWMAYSNLGYVYMAEKQYPQAIQALQKSVELGPNQELAMGNLADAYRYSGQKDKANATYDQAIALAFKELQVNPQDTEAMSDLGLYYAEKGDLNRGMEFVKRARSVDSKDVQLIIKQATIEALARKPADAVKGLKEALSKGYAVKDVLQSREFESLQNRPDFQALIKQYGH
jgi:serine/threonine-protein kinase